MAQALKQTERDLRAKHEAEMAQHKAELESQKAELEKKLAAKRAHESVNASAFALARGRSRSGLAFAAGHAETIEEGVGKGRMALGIPEPAAGMRQGHLRSTAIPTKDPIFTMDSCTFKCRGVPSNCTEEYLGSLFGYYGEFVQVRG